MINNMNISRGDIVKFIFTNGKEEWNLEGTVLVVDRFRNNQGTITNIEYDIEGQDYFDSTKLCLYKHIDHKYILEILKRGTE